MALTASSVAEKEQSLGAKAFSRVLAGIEALVLAGVIYLVSSVQDQKITMAQIQATSQASNIALSSIPGLTIRVVEAEKDISNNANQINETKSRVKDLEDRARLH